DGLKAAADRHGITLTVNHVCGMFGIFFTGSEVTEFDHVANANTELFNRFFHAMLDEGIYLAPSAFETGFVSVAHTPKIIETTLTAADRAFASIAES
ncbi:MAG: aspartate aminotransferase family protein, partial [Gammaproteobacteria bacterium]|nr:aspartate aminotransferase family protein [Gammaproteobacteria bacterium]